MVSEEITKQIGPIIQDCIAHAILTPGCQRYWQDKFSSASDALWSEIIESFVRGAHPALIDILLSGTRPTINDLLDCQVDQLRGLTGVYGKVAYSRKKRWQHVLYCGMSVAGSDTGAHDGCLGIELRTNAHQYTFKRPYPLHLFHELPSRAPDSTYDPDLKILVFWSERQPLPWPDDLYAEMVERSLLFEAVCSILLGSWQSHLTPYLLPAWKGAFTHAPGNPHLALAETRIYQSMVAPTKTRESRNQQSRNRYNLVQEQALLDPQTFHQLQVKIEHDRHVKQVTIHAKNMQRRKDDAAYAAHEAAREAEKYAKAKAKAKLEMARVEKMEFESAMQLTDKQKYHKEYNKMWRAKAKENPEQHAKNQASKRKVKDRIKEERAIAREDKKRAKLVEAESAMESWLEKRGQSSKSTL